MGKTPLIKGNWQLTKPYIIDLPLNNWKGYLEIGQFSDLAGAVPF
jgi:hypothetical protein